MEAVARKHGIPEVPTDDLHSRDYIEKLRKMDIDVILFGVSKILKKELLEVPEKGCLNKHCALLPDYKGLWPVFWALLNGEKEVGVTIHYMTAGIDEGGILAQKAVPVGPEDTVFSLYEKCFRIAPDLIGSVLDGIESGKPQEIVNGKGKGAYFSFPGREDVQRLRKMGKRFL